MNKILKENENYTLILSNGKEYPCTRLYEKKTEKWHVVVPKEAREICGRTFIRESHFDNSPVYEFEDKTEHRTGVSTGGWKAKLTAEEKAELEETASKRVMPKIDPNSEEGLLALIAKYEKKLAETRAKNK